MINPTVVHARCGGIFTYAFLIVVIISLASCSSGNNSTQSSVIKYLGVVTVAEYNLSEGTSDIYLDGNFLVYSRDIHKELEALFDVRNGPVNASEDVCLTPFSDRGALSIGVQVISAGETIIFTDTNGTFATLTEHVDVQSDETFVDYELNLQSVPSPQANLQVVIPGEEFARFDAAIIPSVVAQVDFTALPAGADPLTNLEFSWTPTPENSYLGLTFLATLDDSDISQRITCEVVDDGFFVLDEMVTNELSEYDKLEITRSMAVADRVIIKDETLLLTKREIQLTVQNPPE